jgi:hypothetical protein
MTTLAFAPTTSDVTLVQLNDDLWRVTRADGDVLGYIERFLERGLDRFRAKRMIVAKQRFYPIGEFWLIDDAMECFQPG